jgi:hypothetical protein
MGWNYGGAIIDFDFRTVVNELSEDEARMRHGAETPEELEQKNRIDAGTIALSHFPWDVNAADAPIHFESASSRDFDDYAYAPVGNKTVVLGRNIGMCQEELLEEGKALSSKRGTTLIFWINDASGSYMFSIFRQGQRVRFFSSGPGLDDDEGAPFSAEEGNEHPHDRINALISSFLGRTLSELFDVPFEKYDAL